MGAVCLTGVAWTGSGIRVSGTTDPPWEAGPLPELVLRARDSGQEIAFPAQPLTDDRFDVLVSLADLASDVWDVRLRGARGETPFGAVHAPDVLAKPLRHRLGDVPVTVYLAPARALAIDLGGEPHALPLDVHADSVVWLDSDGAAEPAVVVSGRLGLADQGLPTSATLVLRCQERGDSYEVFATLHQEPELIRYAAVIPLLSAAVDRPLPRGDWDLSLMVAFAGLHRSAPVQAPSDRLDHRWWRRGRPMQVSTSAAPSPLTLSVRPLML